jgi:hypothetical protein
MHRPGCRSMSIAEWALGLPDHWLLASEKTLSFRIA